MEVGLLLKELYLKKNLKNLKIASDLIMSKRDKY